MKRKNQFAFQPLETENGENVCSPLRSILGMDSVGSVETT